jgi:hypothetical protein
MTYAKTIVVKFFPAAYARLIVLTWSIVLCCPILFLIHYILNDYAIYNDITLLPDVLMRDYIGFVLLAVLVLYGLALFKTLKKYRLHKRDKNNCDKIYLAHLKEKKTLRKKYTVTDHIPQLFGFDRKDTYTNSYAYQQWQFISENGQLLFLLNADGWLKNLAFKLHFKENMLVEVHVNDDQDIAYI